VSGDAAQTPALPPPAAGKRERSKAANRAAIIEAAREVFAETGYGAASIRDIVRHTELASGTFYNYFPDKEAVLRAMAEEESGGLRARVREGRLSATTIEDFVAGGFRGYFSYVAQNRSYFELTRRNAGTIRSLLDEPFLGAGVDELQEDLAAAIDAGRLPRTDVEYLTAAMVGVAFELALRMVERDPVEVEGAVRFATDLLMGGIERLGSATL
jgi:AcrR family transcriptional regulator